MTSENSFSQVEARKKRIAYGLFIAALVLAVIPIYMGIKYRMEYLPGCLWGGTLALVALGAGIAQLAAQPSDLSTTDSQRLLVLMIGGLSGIATVVFLGLGLTAKWWDQVTGGWETWQGKDNWHIWACLLSVVAGLAIMFISLQLAQGDKQSSSSYRRFLYAYNTVLTGFLVLLILIVVNVLVYVPWGPLTFFTNTYYWSASSIYALSSQSERVLQGLDKPLKIYVIVPENDPFNHPIHALMDNCRSVQPNIQVKYLSPDLDKEEVGRLSKEYKFGAERSGILLVYGVEPKTENRFIKNEDLRSFEASEMLDRGSQGFFKGESTVINEINSLVEGKEKPVVYFTQGNGELDFADRQPTQRPSERGCGLFRDKIEAMNIKVQGLQLSPVAGLKSKNPDQVIDNKVPDDAAMVIIAGPTRRFEKHAVEALRNYMEPIDPKKKKGKLIIFADPVADSEGKIQPTGLEELLANFNVELGKNRVLELTQSNPEIIRAVVNQNPSVRSQNILVDAFAGPTGYFPVYKARTVESRPGNPSMERYRTDILLVTYFDDSPLTDSNILAYPRKLLRELNDRHELQNRISQEPLSLAVSVSEGGPTPPMNPHAPPPQTEEKPRMVVAGSSSPVRNALANSLAADFFASSIAWLRERPSTIGIEAKKRDFYLPKSDTNYARMMWLPALLMFVGIVGLGTGVWVVRRR